MAESKKSNNVLCVCAGNTCRSPMFAEVLKQELAKLGRHISVESAGYLPRAGDGLPAANEWAVGSGETGIDLSSHRSRRIDGIGDLNRFDLVICLNQAAVKAINELGVKPERVVL